VPATALKAKSKTLKCTLWWTGPINLGTELLEMVVEHFPVSVVAEFLDWEGSDIVESLLGRPLSFNGVPLSEESNLQFMMLSATYMYIFVHNFMPYFHDPLF
jgi:hypothetical protein